MTNELLRPDCYFVMSKKEIAPIPHLTDKELRQAHNLGKMYKAGVLLWPPYPSSLKELVLNQAFWQNLKHASYQIREIRY